MKAYKIELAYDGTAYGGWQQQPGKNSVADTLERTFMRVFNEPISIMGASRTDRGVHALGQVARFRTFLDATDKEIHQAWRNKLPPDIHIRSLIEVPLSFHPQYEVISKTYWYHFFTQHPLPFVTRYGYFMRYPVDHDKLGECLSIFTGTHDFRSFCSGDDMKSTVRTIDTISLHTFKRYNIYRIEFQAKGFLRYMIRRIVGACLAVASDKRRSVNDLVIALEQKDPNQRLPKAPAQGLVLAKIRYKSDEASLSPS